MTPDQPILDSPAAYAALARIYDLQHATYTPDVDMYKHFASEHQARSQDTVILEIGSGTGRIMIPLVEAGYRVVGVDQSPEMLQIARERLAAFPPERWQLIEADARTLNLTDRFGMAFVALNTFLHNLTREHQLEMLAAIRRHLRDDGVLIIDLPPNDELAFQPDTGEFEFEATLIDPLTGATSEKYVASEVFWSRQEQVLSYRIETQTSTGVQTQSVSFKLRHVFKHEMELLLLQSGFSQCQWYGDYDLSDYAEDSLRMIAVARL
ncbi:MAG TPA: class I SAM-dependent methyltransferase [Anaerolineae bacterium]|jgi:ubiquinone/menaquinone biosynthesis C-methylase UbiE